MVMLNGKTYAPSSYVGSPRFTRMEKTACTMFSNGETLGARAPIISGHMLNTLRIQSKSDHNVSSGQKSDTFKMYPVM